MALHNPIKFIASLVPAVVVHAQWALYAQVLTAVFVACVIIDYYRSWSRLKHIKGPFIAAHSRIWLLRAVSGGQMHDDFYRVCQKYGSLARIGPKHLVTSDPFLWRRIIAVRSPYKRSDWYLGMRFDPSKENVESEMDEEKHTALRAKLAAGYSGKDVENLEPSIDQNIAAFIKLIETYVPGKGEFTPLDLGRRVQFFTLDVISTIAHGKPFGFLARDEDVYDYIKTTEKVLPAVLIITVLPWLNYLLQTRFVKKYMPSANDPLGFGKLMAVTKQVVGERFGPDKQVKADMLGSFIRHGLTQDEAESETLLQIIAGSDTTATAIRSTFLYILTCPRVVSKLRAEIANRQVSHPITDAEARNLPYLQAIIKEGLRIHAPVVGLMEKEVPAEGDTINGLFVPGGTNIGFCAKGAWRDKKFWGEDADVFIPERWIDGDAAKIKSQEQILEVIFAVGKWQCLGKNIAMMELNKIYVELLRRFDFAVVDPTKVWSSSCMGVFAQRDFWLNVSKREVI